MAIVRANYIRRGSDPRTAAKKAHRAAKYYTYRDGLDVDERRWYARDGRSGSFAEFRKEIYAQGRAHAYTYRLVLSTKDTDIGPDGYKQVLGERFTQYYFVEHHNTEFPHAHVIGYTERRLHKHELRQLRNRVVELEQAREQVQDRARALGQERQPLRAAARALELD